jgi:hypothetical protein
MPRVIVGCLLALLCGFPAQALAVPLPRDPGKGMPQLVVQVKSINDLLDDLGYLKGKLKNFKDFRDETPLEQIESTVEKFLAARSYALDRTKPFGLYVAARDEIDKSQPVLLIPHKGENDFLKMTKEVLSDLEVDEETRLYRGSFKFIFSNTDVFLRLKNGYAYVTFTDPEPIKDAAKLPSPADLLLKDETALIAARLYLEGVPEPAKKTVREFLATIENPGQIGVQEMIVMSLLGASDARDFARRLRGLVDEAKWAALRLELDRRTDELSLSFTLIPQENTNLAKEIAAFKPKPSQLAELLDGDTAAGILFSYGNFGGLALEPQAVSDLLRQALATAELDGTDPARDLLARALIRSIRVNEADIAVALKKEKQADLYTLVAGAKLNQPTVLAVSMFAYLRTLPEKKRARFTMNAARLDDGTFAHRLTLPTFSDADLKRFGKPEVCFFQKGEMIYAAVGARAVDRLNECLKLKPKEGAQYLVQVDPAKMLDFLKHDATPEIVDDRRQIFEKQGSFRLLHGKVEGGDTLRVRYTADVIPLLRLMFGMWR